MRKSEHVAGHLAKLPSKRELRRIKAALELFGQAYMQWLRSPKGMPQPNPKEFGLTKQQAAALIEGVKIIHKQTIRNQ